MDQKEAGHVGKLEARERKAFEVEIINCLEANLGGISQKREVRQRKIGGGDQNPAGFIVSFEPIVPVYSLQSHVFEVCSKLGNTQIIAHDFEGIRLGSFSKSDVSPNNRSIRGNGYYFLL